MKLVLLANLLETKYDLTSFAVEDEARTLQEVKKIIKNTFMLYVNGASSKEPILQKLADANEPYSKALISSMTKLVNDLDNLSSKQIFNRLNKIAASIYKMTQDHELEVRKSIHNSVRGNREPEINFREFVKSKFGMILYRISGQLVSAANLLAKNLGIKTDVASKIPLPPPKALSKDQHLRFLYSPKAKEVGIDSLELLEQFLHTNRAHQLLDEYIRAKNIHPPVATTIKDIVQNLKDQGPKTEVEDVSNTGTITPEQLFEESENIDPINSDKIASVIWNKNMFTKYNYQSLTNFLKKGV